MTKSKRKVLSSCAVFTYFAAPAVGGARPCRAKRRVEPRLCVSPSSGWTKSTGPWTRALISSRDGETVDRGAWVAGYRSGAGSACTGVEASPHRARLPLDLGRCQQGRSPAAFEAVIPALLTQLSPTEVRRTKENLRLVDPTLVHPGSGRGTGHTSRTAR